MSAMDVTLEAGHRRLASVFGLMGTLDSTAGIVVFVALLVFLIFLEMGFEVLEHWAHENEVNELMEKLKKELMMMGILSFTVFIYQTAAGPLAHSDWYLAFEMSHIILLFIAFAFIIQAAYLLNYAIAQGRSYLKAKRIPASSLLQQIGDLKENNTFAHWCFHSLPFWVPVDYPPLRKRVEVKLLERLFLSIHSLEEDFRFAHYISKLFQMYIGQLGEVSPRSWLIVIVLAVLNYARIVALDDTWNHINCGGSAHRRLDGPGDHAEPLSASAAAQHRLLAVSAGPFCPLYLYGYALFISWLVPLFCAFVLFAAKTYKARVINIALGLIGVPPVSDNRDSYCLALKELERIEAHSTDAVEVLRVKKAASAHNLFDTQQDQHNTHGHGGSQKAPHGGSQKAAHGKHDGASSDKVTVEVEDSSEMAAIKLKMKQRLMELIKKEDGRFEARCCPALHDVLFPKSPNGKMSALFWFDSPDTFFQHVELCLLLQSLYVAIWSTQLIPMAVSYQSAGWGVGFTIPMVLNYFVIRLLLHDAVILQATCEVHSYALAETEEEERMEATIEASIAAKIVKKYSEYCQLTAAEGLEPKAKYVYLESEFMRFDADNSGEISKTELVTFLKQALDIHLTVKEEKVLWLAVDEDFSGEVAWFELYVALFPDDKAMIKDKMECVVTCQRMIVQRLAAEGGAQDGHALCAFLGRLFDQYDADGSGSMDVDEFKVMIAEIAGPDNKVTDKDMRSMFAAIDFDQGGGIERIEFVKLLTPHETPPKAAALVMHVFDSNEKVDEDGRQHKLTFEMTKEDKHSPKAKAEEPATII